MHARSLAAVVVLGVILTSCASPAATAPSPTAPSATSPSATARASAPASPSGTAQARPAFLAYAFTDVRDGRTFRLSEFSGKTVLVIGMAVW